MRFRLHCSQGRRNHRQGRSLRSLIMCPSFLLFPEITALAAMESTLVGQNNPLRPAFITRHTGTGPAARAPNTCHTAMLYIREPKRISICVWMFLACLKPRCACRCLRLAVFRPTERQHGAVTAGPAGGTSHLVCGVTVCASGRFLRRVLPRTPDDDYLF